VMSHWGLKSMFKTRLAQNKETVLAIGIFTGFLILAVINLVILVPYVLGVYGREKAQIKNNPIDTEVVNEAIKLLGP